MQCNKAARLSVDILNKTAGFLFAVLIALICETIHLLFGVLIILMLMGIVLYMVMPEINYESSSNLKLSNLTTNLQSVRAQLELYRLHHNGAYPADITKGLTMKTDSDGTVSDTGEYGPYMEQFPANPFVDNAVQAVKANGADGEGWSYRPTSHARNCRPGECYTRVFFANTPGHEGL